MRKPNGATGVAMRSGMTHEDLDRRPQTGVMNMGDTFHGGVEPTTHCKALADLLNVPGIDAA